MPSSTPAVLFLLRSPAQAGPSWQAGRLAELASGLASSARYRARANDGTLEILGMHDGPRSADAAVAAGVSGWYHARQIAEIGGSHAGPRARDAPVVYTVAFDVPSGREDEFDRWYEEEHAPLLLQSPHWLMCRRFRVTEGGPQPTTHLACYFLAGVHALDAPQREEAKHTPWRLRLAQEPWFKARFDLYEADRRAP